jgi:hypothetical protein
MGFIKDVIDDVIDTVTDVVDDVVDFVGDVVEDVVSWFAPEMPEMPEFGASISNDGILINKRSSEDALPLIYGTRRVGGNIVWLAVSSDNQYLYVVIALCEGQIARMTELYLDDVLYATYTGSDSTYGTTDIVRSSSADFTNPTPTVAPSNTSNLSIETDHPMYKAVETIEDVDTDIFPTEFALFNGTDDGYDYLDLFQGSFSPGGLGWDSAHKGKGICHAMFRFKYNSDAFNGIPKINFTIRGKQILTDLSGSSYAYSANPALVLYDYLTSTRYGKGLSASDINTTTFTTAAGVCNTSVTPFTGASTQNLFETHTILGSRTKLLDNVRKLLTPMRAFFTYSGGLYTVKVEGTGSSALSVTEDMIISGIKVEGESKNNRYNRVITTFADKDNNYQSMEAIYPPTDETNVGVSFKYETMLASDNNEELHLNIDLGATTDYYTAEDLAELILKRSRAGLRIAFTGTSELQNLIVGDIFQITHTGMGFSAKNFIVTGLTLVATGTIDKCGRIYC